MQHTAYTQPHTARARHALRALHALHALRVYCAGSLTLSIINLVKCSLLLRWEARAVGVGVLAHLGQQLQLGRGLPLHALRAQRIDSWQCTVVRVSGREP